MNNFAISWTLAGAALALTWTGCSGSGKEADLPKIEGIWHVESVTADGKPNPRMLGAQFVFGDGKMSIQGAGGEKLPDATFALDASTTPKSIEITTPSAGQTGGGLGIYSIEGDTLQICTARPGEPRPAEFQSTSGSARILIVLKRGATEETP